jgi:hypothetical protein
MLFSPPRIAMHLPFLAVALPSSELPTFEMSGFKPALVPVDLLPLALAPVRLVRVLVDGFLSAVFAIVLVLVIAVCPIPKTNPSALPLLVRLFAAPVVAAIATMLLLLIHRTRKQLAWRFEALEDFVTGDSDAALLFADDAVEESIAASVGLTSDVADAVTALDADDSKPALTETAQDTSIAEIQATLGKVASPKIEFDAVVKRKTIAHIMIGQDAMAAVKAAMEFDPTWAFKRTVNLMMDQALMSVLAVPLVIYLLGCVAPMCETYLNADKLMKFGLLLGVYGLVGRFLLRTCALRQLKHAGSVILECQLKAERQILGVEERRSTEENSLRSYCDLPFGTWIPKIGLSPLQWRLLSNDNNEDETRQQEFDV